ncbi:hypothetical protein, partial [Klebsiella pneumoniae]|uniref:hypothetical protein n=1 Tax=Klebsiella pneumoniae TaxID=573 RepID=UPI001C6A016D
IFSHQASPPRLRPWRHPVLLSRFAAVFYAILGQESPLCSLFGEHEKPRGSHRMMPSTGVKITTIIS